MGASRLLELVFFGCCFAQGLYYLLFFFRLVVYTQSNANQPWDLAVSIVVSVHNEMENLKELLPILEDQQNIELEILIVNDRSSDGTGEFLKEYAAGSSKVNYLTITDACNDFSPKKRALAEGLAQASHEKVLLTDADCRPASRHWAASMASRITSDGQISLGFSPYFKKSGVLNWFIRGETFYTAAMYFSFALAGLPYMGVGRNLIYTKKTFREAGGFRGHQNVIGGDDDLFVQRVANAKNTTVNLNPDSFCYSIPKETWVEWLGQKKRHVKAGKLYTNKIKWLLGLMNATHTGMWIALLGMLIVGFPKGGLALLILLGLRWLILAILNWRFKNQVFALTIPLLDAALALYFLTMGLNLLLDPRPTKKWK